MHSNEPWQIFYDELKEDFPDYSDAKLKELHNCFTYVSCTATDPIVTDIDDEPEPPYRRALNGRYWIFLKLQDYEFWYENHEIFDKCSGRLPHEPANIAASLAIRPANDAAWSAVEAWAWVYRHALMLEVGIDSFEEWCADKTPESSRRAVLLELRRSGHISALTNAEAPSIYDAARGNA